MFSINIIKILTQILLPPGIFLLLLLLTSYYFYKNGWKKASIINLSISLLIYLSFIEPFQDYFYRILEKDLSLNARPEGDVIVVLGGGVYENSPDLTGNTVPSDEALARIVLAYRLYKNLHLPIIVTGGKLTETDVTEAEVSKRFLVEFGVSDKDIIIEDKSRTTKENAMLTREILKKHNFKRPILVTTAYHMKRAILCFRLYNIDVIPAPCSFKTINKTGYKVFNYIPGPANPFPPLKEILGILYMKILLLIS